MRRRISLLFVGVIFLAGCGADVPEEKVEDQEGNVQYLFPYTVTLNDGVVVECVMTTTANGLWCQDSEGEY